MKTRCHQNVRTRKTRISWRVALAFIFVLSIAVTGVRPALGSQQQSITFDDLGLPTLGEVTTQYFARGVIFQGFTSLGAQVNLDVADSTLFQDNKPPSLPYCLSNFYNNDKFQRANILRILFTDTVSTISLMFNGAGPLGTNTVFNVYNTSSVLVHTFTVPSATDSSYHAVNVSDSDVSYIDVVAPTDGWGFYIDNLHFTQNGSGPLPTGLAVPISLNVSLIGTVQNPIPDPNPAGIVKATTTTVKLTRATLLTLAGDAHGLSYPRGASIALTLAGPGPGNSVVVIDKTGTIQLDDISDLLQVNEQTSLRSVSGQWKVDPNTLLKVSGNWTGSELMTFAFDDGAGTSFSASGVAKISYILGAPDRNGNQKLTQSLTLIASGEGTAPNPKDSGFIDQAIGSGTFSASSTHTINQNP